MAANCTGGALERLGVRLAEPKDQRGFTMFEVAVTMAIMMVITCIGLVAAGTFLKVQSEAVAKAVANTRAAQAENDLRQELISANVIFDPALDAWAASPAPPSPWIANENYAGLNPDGTAIAKGWSLRAYTQVSGNPTCVQWRILDTGDMQVRSWSGSWQTNNQVHPWTTLVSGIVNPSSAVPFVLDSGVNYGGGGAGNSRLLDLNLQIQGAARNASPVTIKSSIAAIDAQYFPTSPNNCWPIPSP